MLLSEYAAPTATLKYSPQHFASLTFAHLEELDYPTIASAGIIKQWCFSDEIPASASGTVVQPGECIPSVEDLLPITREMEKAFRNGACSVSLVMNVDGQHHTLQFHFSKICLLISINNNHSAVLGARKLFQHVRSLNLLSPANLEQFSRSHIFAPIAGCKITDFPLWKLACLLGETWLEEDVANALLELLYLQETMKSTNDPSLIILPTSFFNDLQHLFEQSPRLYSTNLHPPSSPSSCDSICYDLLRRLQREPLFWL
ncbi:hypothetical protein C8R45DRAFT_819125 [Mycena sanguinolenta]|nr:hypothetical protein C8R45DRAFT_819125 [Mycena sanguinolenta]